MRSFLQDRTSCTRAHCHHSACSTTTSYMFPRGNRMVGSTIGSLLQEVAPRLITTWVFTRACATKDSWQDFLGDGKEWMQNGYTRGGCAGVDSRSRHGCWRNLSSTVCAGAQLSRKVQTVISDNTKAQHFSIRNTIHLQSHGRACWRIFHYAPHCRVTRETEMLQKWRIKEDIAYTGSLSTSSHPSQSSVATKNLYSHLDRVTWKR
jgi:hypothetical protein